VYMNKLAAKMRTMVARTAHENGHCSTRQARLTVTPYAAVVAAFRSKPQPAASARRYSVACARVRARAAVGRRGAGRARSVALRAGQHRHGPSFGRLDWVRVRAYVDGCEGWNGAGRPRGSQVQQVTHTVHGILKNGVTDSAKIERLLAKFGEAPGPNPSTTLRYSVPAAMLPAAEDQAWMGRANPARPKGKRPVQNVPGAVHPL
jgi:hypothetical protein